MRYPNARVARTPSGACGRQPAGAAPPGGFIGYVDRLTVDAHDFTGRTHDFEPEVATPPRPPPPRPPGAGHEATIFRKKHANKLGAWRHEANATESLASVRLRCRRRGAIVSATR